MTIREVKEEIRILGWDDGSFDNEEDEETPLVGSVVRGGKPYLDGVLVRRIDVDGFDVTEKIINSTNSTKHHDQLRVIMLDGITFAGFNTADIGEIYDDTGLPVIVVTRKDTDFKNFKKAMKNLPDFEKRWKLIEKAGDLKEVSVAGGELYFQNKGLEEGKAKKVIKMSTSKSIVPEPIRLSHLIATGIKRGESIGGA